MDAVQHPASYSIPETNAAIDLDPYSLCVPDTYAPESAFVIKVIDGDSIRVKIKDEIFEVRYIGMNAPEYGQDEDDIAEAATRANRQLVEGKEILLFRDVSNVDRYERLLRYVFVDGMFVNQRLVEDGYARVQAYPPDIACHHVIGGY